MAQKTNYQRLYRQAKKEAKVYHNFSEQLILMVPKMFKLSKADKEKFDGYVRQMKEMNTKVLTV